MQHSPPKYPLRFLRWFCREDYIDEIEGDLLELFEKRVEESPGKARRRFAWDVVKSFRLRNIRSLSNNQNSNYTAMFQHTLLLAFRNFKKYKGSFLINLIGLSSGLACFLLIFLWVNDELGVDKFHAKDNRLYRVMENLSAGENIIGTSDNTASPLAELLLEKMPEVEYAVAVAPPKWYKGFTLTVGDKNVKGKGQYVGRDYFSMFSYWLIHGNADQVLEDKNSIVISEELALSLFNTTEGIVGKAMTFQHEKQFLISGIFRKVPANSSVQFDFVLSFEILKDTEPWIDSWDEIGPQVFVVLKEGTELDQFNAKVAPLISDKWNGLTRTIFLEPYSKNYLYGNYENGVQAGGRIAYVRLFSIIAIFILLIACVNFTNLSTARASRRLKEIGIKKVVGASRRSLILQHFAESLIMSLIALLVAGVFAVLTLPQFNEITQKQLTMNPDGGLILVAVAVALVTGILSGMYPALYLSGLHSLSVLKGKLNTSFGEVWSRKGLVVFQFTLSIMLMVGVMVVHKQISFVQTQDIGYDKENVIYFELEGKAKGNAEMFLSQIKSVPGVIAASATSHDMVGGSWWAGISWPGKDPDDRTSFQITAVDYGLIETLGIELKEGRTFSKSFGADSLKIIFNEAAIEAMGLENPVGKTVNGWGTDLQIIGVVKNFHFESFHEQVKPTYFILRPGAVRFAMVRIANGREKEVIASLEQFYHTYNPGFDLDYRFLDADYQQLHVAEHRVSELSKYFAGLGIIISCLGLSGMAAFVAERRTKEIGIRKILGSGFFGILRLLSEDFTKVVLVAIAIGLPASYFIARNWLDEFAYRIDLKWWYFALSGVLTLVIAWAVVGWQVLKVARINPTECIRGE